MSLRLDPASIHIERVAHGLESEERDSDGKENIQVRNRPIEAKVGGQAPGRTIDEMPVLEHDKDRQVYGDARGKGNFLLTWVWVAVAHDARDVGNQRGGNKKQRVGRIPAHVKEVAGREEQNPSEAVWKQEREPGDHRKKNEV